MKKILGILLLVLAMFWTLFKTPDLIAKLFNIKELLIILIFVLGLGIFSGTINIVHFLTSCRFWVTNHRLEKKFYTVLLKEIKVIALEDQTDKAKMTSICDGIKLPNKEVQDFFKDHLRYIMDQSEINSEFFLQYMTNDIESRQQSRMILYSGLDFMSDAAPAVGILMATITIVNTMLNIATSPEIIGQLMSQAIVGTFMGILCGYALFKPWAMIWHEYSDSVDHALYIIRDSFIRIVKNDLTPTEIIDMARISLPPSSRPDTEKAA